MAKRSELREKCMIILYQYDIQKERNLPVAIDALMKENCPVENEFVKDMVYGTISSLEELDTLANKYLKDWSIDRIDKTGKAILRLALFEIKNMDTPAIVVINEAINLAKKYCDESVRKMINAVLDKVANE